MDMMHRDLLKLLMPPTSYDTSAPTLNAELTAEGNALDTALKSADQVLLEMDARTASLMLGNWESVLGLPDACLVASGVTPTFTQRRAAVVARLNLRGGQNAAFFIGLAQSLGYTVTITELHEQTVNDDVGYPLYGTPWRFVWQVNGALNTIGELSVNDSAADALAWWGNTPLECILNRFKPAHTQAVFAYA